MHLMPARVRAADRYAPTADLSIVTAYFNPAGFRSRRLNYEQFYDRIHAARIPLITVECALAGRPFELPPGPGLRRVRGRDVMWQKERLLNLVIGDLPDTCRKIAWLDADILFENPDWAPETAAQLDKFPVVQMFDRAVRLPRGVVADDGHSDAYSGFAAVYARQPHCLLTGDFAAHGHTGFAWAARREVLAEPGLYDACIAGSGDHMMAHAFCGDWTSACVSRIIGTANHHRRYFANWCRATYPRVRARVGFVVGTVLHLWHGEVGDRRYVDRNRELAGFGFNPAADVRVGQDGCWEWANRKPALHRWAAAYFGRRREDGDNTGGRSDEPV